MKAECISFETMNAKFVHIKDFVCCIAFLKLRWSSAYTIAGIRTKISKILIFLFCNSAQIRKQTSLRKMIFKVLVGFLSRTDCLNSESFTFLFSKQGLKNGPMLWDDQNAWDSGFTPSPTASMGVASFSGNWADPSLAGKLINTYISFLNESNQNPYFYFLCAKLAELMLITVTPDIHGNEV